MHSALLVIWITNTGSKYNFKFNACGKSLSYKRVLSVTQETIVIKETRIDLPLFGTLDGPEMQYWFCWLVLIFDRLAVRWKLIF